MVYSTRRFVVCLSMCHFVLVFFSPFSIAITSLGEERANHSAFRTFVRFVLVWICRFPLPLGVWEGLRFVIVALLGLFSYLFYQYHKLRKAFSKFYRPHYDLVPKFNVGLKSLLQQGPSEPEFYGDLVYKFRKIYACNDFSTQFRKIILRYKKIRYNINACMVVNPITVNNFVSLASLFYCTPAG